jgi:hypothetical protein
MGRACLTGDTPARDLRGHEKERFVEITRFSSLKSTKRAIFLKISATHKTVGQSPAALVQVDGAEITNFALSEAP